MYINYMQHVCLPETDFRNAEHLSAILAGSLTNSVTLSNIPALPEKQARLLPQILTHQLLLSMLYGYVLLVLQWPTTDFSACHHQELFGMVA